MFQWLLTLGIVAAAVIGYGFSIWLGGIEKTGTADPQLIDAIVRDNIGPNADLRRGLLLICVAAAFAILGLSVSAVGGEEAIFPMLGVASFPGLIGVAYIGFHFFAPREPTI